jgi:hypothetical protein
VRQSIQVETTHKGWCDRCKRYQNQHTRKSITKLPDVLTFNATTSDKNSTISKDYWSTPGWLPDEIGLTLNNKLLNVWQGEDLKKVAKRSNDQADLKIYELVGFVAEVKDEDERKKHMVAFVNGKGMTYRQGEALTNSPQYRSLQRSGRKSATGIYSTTSWCSPFLKRRHWTFRQSGRLHQFSATN